MKDLVISYDHEGKTIADTVLLNGKPPLRDFKKFYSKEAHREICDKVINGPHETKAEFSPYVRIVQAAYAAKKTTKARIKFAFEVGHTLSQGSEETRLSAVGSILATDNRLPSEAIENIMKQTPSDSPAEVFYLMPFLLIGVFTQLGKTSAEEKHRLMAKLMLKTFAEKMGQEEEVD